MTPNFLLIKSECVNENQNAPCRIIIQEVKDGNLLPQHVTVLNHGDVKFNYAISGLTSADLKSYPELPDVWPEIERYIQKYDVILSSSDGYDIRVLFNALERYSINYKPIQYVNAKAICRKGLDCISYNFNLLCDTYLDCYIPESETDKIAEAWAKLTCLALSGSEHLSISDFAKNNKIHVGYFLPNNFEHSHIIHVKKKHDYKSDESFVVTPDENNPFFDMSVVFSGSFKLFNRHDLEKMVAEIGAHPKKSVSTNTDYLVLGDLSVQNGTSRKMKEAIKLKEKGGHIEVISEDDFCEMMRINKLK